MIELCSITSHSTPPGRYVNIDRATNVRELNPDTNIVPNNSLYGDFLADESVQAQVAFVNVQDHRDKVDEDGNPTSITTARSPAAAQVYHRDDGSGLDFLLR
jgi:hypothetical protein